MFVRFEKNWFGPDQIRYRKCASGEVREVPDEYEDILPSTAEIIGARKAKEIIASAEADAAAQSRETLADYDEERMAAEATEEAIRRADARVGKEPPEKPARRRGRPPAAKKAAAPKRKTASKRK